MEKSELTAEELAFIKEVKKLDIKDIDDTTWVKLYHNNAFYKLYNQYKSVLYNAKLANKTREDKLKRLEKTNSENMAILNKILSHHLITKTDEKAIKFQIDDVEFINDEIQELYFDEDLYDCEQYHKNIIWEIANLTQGSIICANYEGLSPSDLRKILKQNREKYIELMQEYEQNYFACRERVIGRAEEKNKIFEDKAYVIEKDLEDKKLYIIMLTQSIEAREQKIKEAKRNLKTTKHLEEENILVKHYHKQRRNSDMKNALSEYWDKVDKIENGVEETTK